MNRSILLGIGTIRFLDNHVALLSIRGGRLRRGALHRTCEWFDQPSTGDSRLAMPGIPPSCRRIRAASRILVMPVTFVSNTSRVRHAPYTVTIAFFETYFSQYPGHYFTGDGNRRRHDQIKIVGRVDDVLNVSGHRIGTAELESTIIEVEGISEVAVVGLPHEIKGEGICAFVCSSLSPDSLLTQINQALRASIGAHAKLDELYRISALPKTRSGKCMRRVLRRLALDPRASLGDLSTWRTRVVEDIRRTFHESRPGQISKIR